MRAEHPIADFFADLRFSSRMQDRVPDDLRLPDMAAAYMGAAFPAIEIVDHRLGDWGRYDALSLRLLGREDRRPPGYLPWDSYGKNIQTHNFPDT
jgi:hypothetical protein